MTGYKERTLQRKCQKMGCIKIENKYRLTMKEIQEIQKTGTKHDPAVRR